MRTAKSTGRMVGVLLFLQLAGLTGPFVLLFPLMAGPQAALANAAGASLQIKLAVVLLLVNCALTIGITIASFAIFRQLSEAMALWLLAASVILFVAQAVDNVHIMSMLSLSQEYVRTGASGGGLFQALAEVVGSTRKWAHFTELLVIDCWIFLFYAVLYRFALVPRALAVFGLVTVLFHFTGIPLLGFLGYGVVMPMGASMAVSHVALALWLVIRGFDARAMTR